jgi:hypothetical protein
MLLTHCFEGSKGNVGKRIENCKEFEPIFGIIYIETALSQDFL